MAKTLDEAGLHPDEHGRVEHSSDNKKAMQQLLDNTGPGFCLAKWTQVTMHLGAGLTHSCHHPATHKIPLEEIAANPGALHNTSFKKEQRKTMLKGGRPKECDYCWRIEDGKKGGEDGNYSDRLYKSIDTFSVKDHDDISQLTGDENIYPRYVEVSFSNVCNFKCTYCGPTFSSKWVEEVKEHGSYHLEDQYAYPGTVDVQIKNREDNPYTEAFWKWWPEAMKHMHTFRITGGEPLLSKHTFKCIDYLLANPNPDLEFAINTNAGVPRKVWEQFVTKINKLEETNSIKKFTLFVSAEATGAQCEYIREGMVWDEFTSNVKYFLNNTKDMRVTFMSAFNLLSAPTFKDFLKYVLSLKRDYSSSNLQKWVKENTNTTPNAIKTLPSRHPNNISTKQNFGRVGVDIPFVRHPGFLDARLLTKDVVEKYLIPAMDFMVQNRIHEGWNDCLGFEVQEIDKFKRILFDLMMQLNYAHDDETKSNRSHAQSRRRFVGFVSEIRVRRGKDFLKTFPELEHFLNICKLETRKRDKEATAIKVENG